MASVQTASKLMSELAVTMYDHDPDGTSATAVEWVSMVGFDSILVAAMASALTGAGCNALSIRGATDSSGTNATIIDSHAVGSAPDAVGDTLVLEVTAEQIAAVGRAAGYAFTHVSAYITMANAADENVVTYIRKGLRQYDGLTADVVS